MAIDVSADGSVIVGSGHTDGGHRAFRWTQEGGMVAIGDPPSGSWGSRAYATSADGSVIVGSNDFEAFIWDAENGMRHLEDVLMGLGLDLTGWDLSTATSITPDGLTIVGRGSGPNVTGGEAWIAHIPEPSTLSLLALGGLVLMRRQRF